MQKINYVWHNKMWTYMFVPKLRLFLKEKKDGRKISADFMSSER
jgi:hypothetical protein